MKQLFLLGLKTALAKTDEYFTDLLDFMGVATPARVPCHKPSGQYGPINPGREPLLEAVTRLLRPLRVTGVIDCGAFNGHLSQIYSQLFPEALIFAFEPIPEMYQRLQERSRAVPRIRPFPQAVGSMSGKGEFFETHNPGASSLSEATTDGHHYYPNDYALKKNYKVEITTLDDWWQKNGNPAIHFLKMDVQGAELEVLKGAPHVLQEAGVRLIQAEVVFFRQYDNGCLFSELERFLRENGFVFYQLYELWTQPDGRLTGGDALFFSQKVMDRLIRGQ